ncbi:hypothetical protein [Methanimicrococcus blatticola]|nr:hypothetical protein [Methanimicrococcus blatticola]MBZ3936379.1 hypothetical protein [Methanimicrococcus blatticola]MCC2509541.1 hypothetical protein [Methanimicrococcus blatticola]
MVLLVAACAFSGCLNKAQANDFIGSWEATETDDTIFTFYENGTCGIHAGNLIAQGEWKPDGENYGLYCYGIRAGTASFVNDDLIHLQLTYGMLDLNEDFKRVAA